MVCWLIIEPQFFADSFFVKNPERVETILFIISLCLLVYNLGQRELRKTLLWSNSKVRNQLGKLTNTPTLRWIFQCFQVVHFLRINQSPQVVNLTEERSLILEFYPRVVKNIIWETIIRSDRLPVRFAIDFQSASRTHYLKS